MITLGCRQHLPAAWLGLAAARLPNAESDRSQSGGAPAAQAPLPGVPPLPHALPGAWRLTVDPHSAAAVREHTELANEGAGSGLPGHTDSVDACVITRGKAYLCSKHWLRLCRSR